MNESVKSISNESSNISWDSVISDFKSNVEASTQEIYEEYYDSTTKQPLHGGILTTLEKQLISKLDYIGKRVDNSDNLLCTHSYFPNMELYFHFIGDQTIPLSISSKH